jgi:hypothetical protein
VNTTRTGYRIAAGLTSAMVMLATPRLAWAEPTKAPKNVVEGPDLAAGARNAPGAAAINDLIDTIGFYAIWAASDFPDNGIAGIYAAAWVFMYSVRTSCGVL